MRQIRTDDECVFECFAKGRHCVVDSGDLEIGFHGNICHILPHTIVAAMGVPALSRSKARLCRAYGMKTIDHVRKVLEAGIERLVFTSKEQYDDIRNLGVGSETGQTSREKKVVVLRELHKAIIYTTKMSKQVTKSHVRM